MTTSSIGQRLILGCSCHLLHVWDVKGTKELINLYITFEEVSNENCDFSEFNKNQVRKKIKDVLTRCFSLVICFRKSSETMQFLGILPLAYVDLNNDDINTENAKTKVIVRFLVLYCFTEKSNFCYTDPSSYNFFRLRI